MQLLTARPKSRGTVGLKSTNPFDLAKVSKHGRLYNSHYVSASNIQFNTHANLAFACNSHYVYCLGQVLACT